MTGLWLTTAYFVLVGLLHLFVAVWVLRFPRRDDRLWFAATSLVWAMAFTARALWPFGAIEYYAETVMLLAALVLPVCWLEAAAAFRRPRGESRIAILRVAIGLTLAIGWLYACARHPPLRAEEGNAWVFSPLVRWMFVGMLLYGAAVLAIYDRGFRERRGRLRRLLYPATAATLIHFGVIIYIALRGFLFSQFDDFMWWVLTLPTVALGFTGAAVVSRPAESPGELSPRGAYASGALFVLGAYLMFLGVLGKVIQWLGWNLEVYLSVLAGVLAVVVFAFLTLSPRTRKRAKRLVDRSVLDGKIGFAQRWKEFGDPFSTTLDQSELAKDVAENLQDVFTPTVVFYLLHRVRHRWEAYFPFGLHDAPAFAVGSEAADWLWRRSDPVDVATWRHELSDTSNAPEIDRLVERFGAALVVPLVARHEMYGWILLGKRRDDLDYDHEDFEFLASIAGPASLALLTCRVSEELIERREMESFHRIATFVVHDLKNSVSMLSMLVQNARKSMSDPRFQRQALETITDAVARMQRLIQRVSVDAPTVTHDAGPVDLATVIREVADAAGIDRDRKIELRFDAEPPPAGDARAWANPDDVRKILENLLINAVEAMQNGGTLTVSITPDDRTVDDGFVRMTVSDTGCGMTDEFIDTQLFRPFQTTKAKGLGIGLFQVRELVERSGGRIGVESRTEPPTGTTFTVCWPRAVKDAGRNDGSR